MGSLDMGILVLIFAPVVVGLAALILGRHTA